MLGNFYKQINNLATSIQFLFFSVLTQNNFCTYSKHENIKIPKKKIEEKINNNIKLKFKYSAFMVHQF